MRNEQEHHKKVIEYFKKSKLGYDVVLWGAKHFGFYPRAKKDISEKKAQELMHDLLAKNLDIKKNQLILDAGCGQGIVSTYLARKYGCKITGITIVPFEIEKADELAKKLRVEDKTEYHLMDYSNTNFQDNQFDAIYTMESFVHTPNIKRTLHEFFRILKPGGRLAMFEYTMADDEAFTESERKIFNMVMEIGAITALKNMRHDSFPETLKGTGFKSVKEQDISRNAGPSFRRLHRLSIIPYFFIKLFGLQRKFINVTTGYEAYKMAKKGLFRYCIFTARKPK